MRPRGADQDDHRQRRRDEEHEHVFRRRELQRETADVHRIPERTAGVIRILPAETEVFRERRLPVRHLDVVAVRDMRRDDVDFGRRRMFGGRRRMLLRGRGGRRRVRRVLYRGLRNRRGLMALRLKSHGRKGKRQREKQSPQARHVLRKSGSISVDTNRNIARPSNEEEIGSPNAGTANRPKASSTTKRNPIPIPHPAITFCRRANSRAMANATICTTNATTAAMPNARLDVVSLNSSTAITQAAPIAAAQAAAKRNERFIASSGGSALHLHAVAVPSACGRWSRSWPRRQRRRTPSGRAARFPASCPATDRPAGTG